MNSLTPVRRACAAVLGLTLLGLLGPTAGATEEPRYELTERFADVEIRRYDRFAVAEIKVEEPFEKAGSQAFGNLFGYISGGNAGSERIEMTAPVRQRPELDTDEFSVSFVLPARFEPESAPQPSDPAVRIREVPERTMAAIRYSGTWSEVRFRHYEAKLRASLEARGYRAVGPAEWARYNAPFTPGFLRRNEVLIEVALPTVSG